MRKYQGLYTLQCSLSVDIPLENNEAYGVHKSEYERTTEMPSETCSQEALDLKSNVAYGVRGGASCCH